MAGVVMADLVQVGTRRDAGKFSFVVTGLVIENCDCRL